MHILAINNPQSTIMPPFWVVAIAILMSGVVLSAVGSAIALVMMR
ncbi:hypothetical protein [Nostoc sp. FACHB-888]|nr:hypothetical protein [Nostoc sp. FACHB-888]